MKTGKDKVINKENNDKTDKKCKNNDDDNKEGSDVEEDKIKIKLTESIVVNEKISTLTDTLVDKKIKTTEP